jgi:transposase InsO family protein
VTWACDFFTVPTLWFGQLYVLFFVKLGTREVLHWNVTYHPTREWTAQQLRNVLAWSGREAPRFLLRDRDGKFGPAFDAVAGSEGTRVLETSHPTENAHAERLVGTVRREVLRDFVVLGEKHLRWILGEFFTHYNAARAHQALGQRIPAEVEVPVARSGRGRVVRRDILNGLIPEYRRVA